MTVVAEPFEKATADATASGLPYTGRERRSHSRRAADDPVGLRGYQLRHDVHNVVATINLLAAAMTPADEHATGTELQQMLVELQRLIMLIESESAEEAMRPTRVDLLVQELVATLRLTTTTRLECAGGATWADVNPLQLWRALRNLVDNAVRAAGIGGRVSVRVSDRDGWVLTEIEDDGPGFGAAPAGRDSLGLSIVRALAERHGGHLAIERSRLGGCAVRMWLPSRDLGRDVAPVGATVPASESGATPMSLLVCDAHRLFAESLATVLCERGYRAAAISESLAEARSVLARTRVDVCVFDLHVDDEPVLRLVPALRRAAPSTRFVLLSGDLDEQVVAEAAAAGITACLHKEQPIDDIIEALERVHAGIWQRNWRPDAKPLAHRDDASRLASFLTHREMEVLAHLVRGDSTAAVARTMAISRNTARSHVQRVLIKLGVHSRLEAAAFAVRHGLVHPGDTPAATRATGTR
jgi:two-component system, NarL family, nitrate/nitrite response regulator NarL